jgi:glycosyltransferase involved in cell wall biosynthesis
MITIGIWYYADSDGLQRTVASVRAHSAGAYNLIVLGDGLQATTGDAAELPQRNSDRALGAAACFNRLIAHDRADAVVFLESGSLVTAGWLERLVAAAEADSRHGLAGPSTNRAWNPQRLPEAPAEDASDRQVQDFAAQVARRFQGAYRTLEPLYSLADFCYLVTRRAIDAIGEADARYGRGPCWEMDYNIRAARAGFQGLWACGAYVHRAAPQAQRLRDEARLFSANRRRYQDKFCQLQLERRRRAYCQHCEGEACAAFAPKALVQLVLPARPSRERAAGTTSAGPSSDRLSDVQSPAHSPAQPALGPFPTQASVHPALVSCIMPTYNRRPFVGQAIAYFLRQDYPCRELLIIDDGSDPVQDLIPDDPRLRYVRLARRQTIGAKRNLACQEAYGEVIVHWDDDDWMAPWRLSYQVDSLRAARADICGLDRVLFYEPRAERAWQYVYPDGGKPWVAGGTLCYTKRYWRQHPFPDINVGEDSRFVWSDAAVRLHVLRDGTFYVALIHPRNTSPKVVTDRRWRPYPVGEIRTLLAQDWAFYQRRGAGQTDSAADMSRLANPAIGASHRTPLVSCIMPTSNRRRFVPQAVEYFLRQDYPHRELIIVDDGAEPVADLIASDEAIRYIHLTGKHSIGAKRNIACDIAGGALIACWDDDDWYAAHRISRQVAPLLAGEADVSGLDRSLLLSLPSRQFWAPTPQLHRRMFAEGVVGGTIVFWKRLWEHGGRFPDSSLAEDAAFLQTLMRSGARLARVSNDDAFIYVRHGQNSWQFTPGQFLDGRGWRRVEPPAFLPEADRRFYGLPALALPGVR